MADKVQCSAARAFSSINARMYLSINKAEISATYVLLGNIV